MNRRNFIENAVMVTVGTVACGSIVKAGENVRANVKKQVHTQNETITVSDGVNAYTANITPDDLANANMNAQGQRELSMEVPDSDLPYQLVSSSVPVLGVWTGVGHLPTDFMCVVIVVIIAIIVLGIIYYYLVKMCKLIPKDPPKDGS
jgi:hypothetical protein